jgi:hypothetical protein
LLSTPHYDLRKIILSQASISLVSMVEVAAMQAVEIRSTSAESAFNKRITHARNAHGDPFCRPHAVCPVENAERETFQTKTQN